ncbi:MAG: hypothetical protein U1F76_23170 [Candidatus Competibacteraceae bacterium]
MHDDQYLAAGYPIASGVIEGACRQAITDRLERTGMHWTVPSAQALLRLRCVALNGDWEVFLNHYIDQESKRLYPHPIGSSKPNGPYLKRLDRERARLVTPIRNQLLKVQIDEFQRRTGKYYQLLSFLPACLSS